MRKLAILGLIILIALVSLVTLAAVNFMGIRDTIYNGIQGTVLQPGHDWIVNTWFAIGDLGFTYIAATGLGLMIFGGLFMVFIVYGLFWQKLVQGKILHKTVPSTTPSMPLQRTLSTPLTVTPTPVEPKVIVEEPKKEEQTA